MSLISRIRHAFKKEVRLGLALGSGGARGLAHIGAIKVLHEEGVPLHCIAGASAGAVVGGLYSAGASPGELEDLALGLSIKKMARLFLPSFNRGGFIDGRRIKELLEGYTRGRLIEELAPRFACVATDLYSGERVVFDRGDLLDAIRASISIPGLFTPVVSGGRVLVDGGVADPLPVSLALEMGATFVIAVRVGRQSASKGPEDTEAPPSRRGDKVSVPPVLETILSTISIYERRLTDLGIREGKDHIVIEPELAGIEILDFHKASRAIAAGEAAMRECLKKVKVQRQ